MAIDTGIEHLDMQFDHHLFLQKPTAIGLIKSRDLIQLITVAAYENKWRSNYKSKVYGRQRQ